MTVISSGMIRIRNFGLGFKNIYHSEMISIDVGESELAVVTGFLGLEY